MGIFQTSGEETVMLDAHMNGGHWNFGMEKILYGE